MFEEREENCSMHSDPRRLMKLDFLPALGVKCKHNLLPTIFGGFTFQSHGQNEKKIWSYCQVSCTFWGNTLS